jgi:hypothetical protein
MGRRRQSRWSMDQSTDWPLDYRVVGQPPLLQAPRLPEVLYSPRCYTLRPRRFTKSGQASTRTQFIIHYLLLQRRIYGKDHQLPRRYYQGSNLQSPSGPAQGTVQYKSLPPRNAQTGADQPYRSARPPFDFIFFSSLTSRSKLPLPLVNRQNKRTANEPYSFLSSPSLLFSSFDFSLTALAFLEKTISLAGIDAPP